MDFMGDALANGRKIRLLNIVDAYSRECLRIEVDTSLPGARVARVLEELRTNRGLPEQIMTDIAHRGQHANGYGQVEYRAFFLDVRRGQIDRQALLGHLEAGVPRRSL